MSESVVERLRVRVLELQALAQRRQLNRAERIEWANLSLDALAVVDAAKDFCEACLDRVPSAYESQPDLVWLQGSANPTGLTLLEALELVENRCRREVNLESVRSEDAD